MFIKYAFLLAALPRHRFTQTAVASFGVSSSRQSMCGLVPAGFTRLTPEVLDWVKTVTGMDPPGVSDPGEMTIVLLPLFLPHFSRAHYWR